MISLSINYFAFAVEDNPTPDGFESEALQKAPVWEFGAGVASLYLPDYHGSNEYRPYLFPVPYIVYRGDKLRIDDAGVTGKLLNTKRFMLDISGGAGMPVGKRSKIRAGMPELNPTVEFGPMLTIFLYDTNRKHWSLNIAVREVVSVGLDGVKPKGRVLAPHLKYHVLKEKRWDDFYEFYISLSPTFGSKKYHHYYYGVDSEYATNERAQYSAVAGYQGTRFTITYKIRKKNRWWGAFFQYESLKEAVFETSPLVQSQNFFAVGLASSWVFY